MPDPDPTAPPPLEYRTPAAAPAVAGRSPVRTLLILFGILAGLAAVPMTAIVLILWYVSPPSSAEFDVRNDTGQPMTAFTLTCRGRTAACGPLAAGRTSSVTLPTAYRVPYTYTATFADGRTFTGTAARWGDEDDRGPWPSFTVAVKVDAGAMTCEAIGNQP